MSNLNINKAILAGRITRDVELKQTQSGVPVCTFSLAINRAYEAGGQKQTDFIECVAWRKTAEFVSRYFRKGSAICLTGSIQTRSYEARDGGKRTATEIVVDEAMFVDGKTEAEGTNEAYTSPTGFSAPPAYTPPTPPAFTALSNDDDIPF